MILEWSLERNPEAVNCKPFADVPSISLKLMTEAHNWKKKKPNIRSQNDMEGVYFIAAHGQRLRDSDIGTFLRQTRLRNWKRF